MKIYDSLSKKIKNLNTNRPVNIYVCGPTVYDYCHIGHARILINFDVLIRLLKYYEIDYKFIQNITDIDDKIIKKAQEQNKNPKEIASYYTMKFFEILDLLNIVKAHAYPLVTNHIPDIINYINDLINKDMAYINSSGVYLNTAKINYYNFEKKTEGLSKIDQEINKINIDDFALAKFNTEGERWSSNFGDFRPGWHIECSVLCEQNLDYITIHGGGLDLKFPHHENEIAQFLAKNSSCCAEDLCDIWMHNNMININKEKMSKSLNNFKYIHDFILNSLDADIFRYFVYGYSYESIIELDYEKLDQAKKTFMTIRKFYFEHLDKQNIINKKYTYDELENNLNTFGALQSLNKFIQHLDYDRFFNLIFILGFQMENFCKLDINEINKFIEERKQAKFNKDFEKADEIKKYLKKHFIDLVDLKEETRWYFI
jgi:cysteinyl-tRNA synthetase